MRNLLRKAISSYNRNGAAYLLKLGPRYVYDQLVAPRLPRRYGEFNSVTTNTSRLFDGVLPWRRRYRPEYESGLATAIAATVEPGDTVVIVGGGIGVTAVKAAQAAGADGTVVVFEGAAKKVDAVRETVRLNDVSDVVDVRHAVVGEAFTLWGDPNGADDLSPSDLPDCDVLELDCEGTEVEILRNLDISPRAILVESHGMHDASTETVKQILSDLSYDVVADEIADRGLELVCRENDIRAITAVANEANHRTAPEEHHEYDV